MSTHAVDVAERDEIIERLKALVDSTEESVFRLCDERDRLRAQRDALLAAAKLAVADAEKAVNPEARLCAYKKFIAAIALAEKE